MPAVRQHIAWPFRPSGCLCGNINLSRNCSSARTALTRLPQPPRRRSGFFLARSASSPRFHNNHSHQDVFGDTRDCGLRDNFDGSSRRAEKQEEARSVPCCGLELSAVCSRYLRGSTGRRPRICETRDQALQPQGAATERSGIWEGNLEHGICSSDEQSCTTTEPTDSHRLPSRHATERSQSPHLPATVVYVTVNYSPVSTTWALTRVSSSLVERGN